MLLCDMLGQKNYCFLPRVFNSTGQLGDLIGRTDKHQLKGGGDWAGSPSHNALRMNYIINRPLSRHVTC